MNMRKTGAFCSLWLLAAVASAQVPPMISVPPAGKCYTDPVTGNRVCRVTDRSICANGGEHNYSYWPAWNQSGTHLVVVCKRWTAARDGGTLHLLLVRDSDLAILGSGAMLGAPALNPLTVFWAWTDPNLIYAQGSGHNVGQLWQWNPFARKAKKIKDFYGLRVLDRKVADMFLAYVSFDDRYFLLQFKSGGRDFALAVYDKQADALVGVLDLSQFRAYDEAVFTKDNHVWVVADAGAKLESFRYSLDFTERVRVAEHGHHAHGLLPDGTPVAVKEEPNRGCAADSPSGVPNNPWKPSGMVLDERVDTTGTPRPLGPLKSQLLQLGCNIPGQHHYQHYSWNNKQRDGFFVSSLGYSGFETDPTAFGILRVRLKFDAAGKIIGDEIDLLAHHRSNPKGPYLAYPRATCNQQGTRCLFSSTMTVQTDNTDHQPHLYVVDFKP